MQSNGCHVTSSFFVECDGAAQCFMMSSNSEVVSPSELMADKERSERSSVEGVSEADVSDVVVPADE